MYSKHELHSPNQKLFSSKIGKVSFILYEIQHRVDDHLSIDTQLFKVCGKRVCFLPGADRKSSSHSWWLFLWNPAGTNSYRHWCSNLFHLNVIKNINFGVFRLFLQVCTLYTVQIRLLFAWSFEKVFWEHAAI